MHCQPPSVLRHAKLSTNPLFRNAEDLSRHFVRKPIAPGQQVATVIKVEDEIPVAVDKLASSLDMVVQSIERDEEEHMAPIDQETTPATVSAIFDFDFDDETISSNATDSTIQMAPKMPAKRKNIFLAKLQRSPNDIATESASEFKSSCKPASKSSSIRPKSLAFKCRDGFEGAEVISNGAGFQYAAKRRRKRDLIMGSLTTHKEWLLPYKNKSKRADKVVFDSTVDLPAEEKRYELTCFGQLELTQEPAANMSIRSAAETEHTVSLLAMDNAIGVMGQFCLNPARFQARETQGNFPHVAYKGYDSVIPKPMPLRQRHSTPLGFCTSFVRELQSEENNDSGIGGLRADVGTNSASPNETLVFDPEGFEVEETTSELVLDTLKDNDPAIVNALAGTSDISEASNYDSVMVSSVLDAVIAQTASIHCDSNSDEQCQMQLDESLTGRVVCETPEPVVDQEPDIDGGMPQESRYIQGGVENDEDGVAAMRETVRVLDSSPEL